MSRTPVPVGTERGQVIPPNQPGATGNGATNSYLPLSREIGGLIPSNFGAGGDRRSGSVSLDGMPSPVHPPDHRFDVGMAKMPQPPSAVEPGKGAIPVSPWDASGRPNRTITEPDTAPPTLK